jgi:hypothetical protein
VGGVADIVVNIIGAVGCVIGTVGSMAGFGNRLSSGREPKAIFAGTALGLGTSLTLWFTGHAAITTVVGITSFLTGGLALPVWAIGALFVVGFTGSNVSSFDYHARAWRYLKYVKARYFDHDPNAKETIQKDFHQFRGSTVGILSGFITATIVVVTVGIFVTQPWFLAIPAAFGVYFVCTSLFAGLCGRIGRELDEFFAKFQFFQPTAPDDEEPKKINPPTSPEVEKVQTRPLTPSPNILKSLKEKPPITPQKKRIPSPSLKEEEEVQVVEYSSCRNTFFYTHSTQNVSIQQLSVIQSCS